VQDDAILPVSPFLSVRYQLGMLLGVDDFDVAAAHPRGKVRLHNAWLHGPGVVWGLGVEAPPRSASDPALSGEIQVLPGLALDRLGHELHLDQPACVDVGAWYAQQKEALGDPTLGGAAVVDEGTGEVTAQLRVEARFRACLTRQVPALAEPCDGGGGTDTAYSRAFETVELKLVPGLATPVDDREPGRYPRLRLLFGLLAPADPASPAPWEQEVLDARAAIATGAELLAALRRFAALDGIALGPGTAPSGRRLLFPGGPGADEDAPVVLADLRDVRLARDGDRHRMTAVEIRPEVRPSHVATSTIQELHRWPELGAGAPTASATFSADPPRVVLRSQTLPFDPASVEENSISVTALVPDGWIDMELESLTVDAAEKEVEIILRERPPAGSVVRLLARGTGATPLLCVDGAGKRVPFRGDRGRGGPHDGSDFTQSWEVPA
jgi:hypothetical protein